MPLKYFHDNPERWGRHTLVRDAYGIARPPADPEALLGLEFEMEGRGMHPDIVERMRDWKGVNDGSLRGQSAEFVSRHPLSRQNYRRALELLRDKIAEHGARVEPSQRCSTHVHLNFADSRVTQAANFIFLWFLVENFLTEYSGETRIGNNFCLRLCDAEDYLDLICEALHTGDFNNLAGQRIRYAALNVSSLIKYGTLEVRTYRGVADPTEINPWLDMLLELYDAAHRFETPLHIIGEFSGNTPQGFVSQNLPIIWRLIRNRRNLTDELYEAVRRCQDLAYLIRWDALPERAEVRTRRQQHMEAGLVLPVEGDMWNHVVEDDDDDDF